MTDDRGALGAEHAGYVRALAAGAGVIDEYFDTKGRRHVTTDETRLAILAALGVEAGSEASARDALEARDRDAAGDLLPPVRVVQTGDPSLEWLVAHPDATGSADGAWRLEVETDSGARHTSEGRWQGDAELRVPLPPALPLGYHRARLSVSASGRAERCDEQVLIVVPPRCTTPPDVIGDAQGFGFIANLYSLRSRTNWGAGDLTDLSAAAIWAGSVGADFVGVNPLHALLNRGADISPYGPVSRLFRNPLYIDVARVPELRDAPALAERLASPEFAAELAELRAAPDIRYEQVMAVKGMALDALHAVFARRVRGTSSDRDRAYTAFLNRGGAALERFATWMAIAERQSGADWRAWPAELRNPSSDAVRAFARDHEARVDFHRWVQFEIDQQLADAAACGREAGLRIGLYPDLAIGSSPAGADTWAYPELFVRGVSVGAPPDPYAAEGQNWGLPPLDPRALKRDRYRYFIDLIRAGLEHAGALRVDHVMGLFRLFWIPNGSPASAGAYVRYPATDLLGIVALESVRHRALIVGEDLGTVPEEVPGALRRWGVLSSKVLRFERDHAGAFRPAASYPPLSLATANTHDMATLSGFWGGRDIALRREVGLITTDAEEARERAERDDERGALIRLLEQEGVLRHGHTPESLAELRAAVHAFLRKTPAQLVGYSLDDMAGEVEPVNIPGVGYERFASWARKMRADLETITTSHDSGAILREPSDTPAPSPRADSASS